MGMRPGQAKGPYVGLNGSGSGGGGIELVISLYDPTDGTPPSPVIGDKYLSTATANGWLADYVYEWSGSSWTGSAPFEGRLLFAKQLNQMYSYSQGSWHEYPETWVEPVIAVYDNSVALPGTPEE